MASRLCAWTIAAGLLAWITALPAYSEEQSCPETNAGLSLPKGFCATIFADKIGHARQLAVAPIKASRWATLDRRSNFCDGGRRWKRRSADPRRRSG